MYFLSLLYCVIVTFCPDLHRYVWSGGIVLLAILLNVYVKNRSKVDPWLSLKVKQCSHTLFARRRSYYSSTKIHV